MSENQFSLSTSTKQSEGKHGESIGTFPETLQRLVFLILPAGWLNWGLVLLVDSFVFWHNCFRKLHSMTGVQNTTITSGMPNCSFRKLRLILLW